ncbi:GyrI-like domain-containing protein [Lachnoclostridium sp.]|uniref:GyrI-like domain-containing protein n=1 Tax=Lachnoclostridium sp. TaxID=2028282 RepID=UPI0028977045|nr:GyrI-like domain-containing protein [Lachnoclostridium sp.]
MTSYSSYHFQRIFNYITGIPLSEYIQYMRDGIYVSDQYVRLHILAGQWAIFSANDCEVSALWARIYSEWLPNSGYELINKTAFEMYYGNHRKGEKRGEIWVPIKHKTTVPSSFNRALELRKGLSNRACQLSIGNFDMEEVYNAHIEKKGWPEHGSIYHLTAPTKVTNHYRKQK